MGLLTNTFFLISTALLLPCMLALLWYLARALWLVGHTLREQVQRAQTRSSWQAYAAALETGADDLPDAPGTGPTASLFQRLSQVTGDAALAEKLICETLLRWQNDQEQLRGLVRNGPALGLMGTLIPLGPALVGLAAGDIQSMANNLIIAFSTTVVGLVIAMIGGSLLSLRKSWNQEDELLLTFAVERHAQRSASAARGSHQALRSGGALPGHRDRNGDTRVLAAIAVGKEGRS